MRKQQEKTRTKKKKGRTVGRERERERRKEIEIERERWGQGREERWGGGSGGESPRWLRRVMGFRGPRLAAGHHKRKLGPMIDIWIKNLIDYLYGVPRPGLFCEREEKNFVINTLRDVPVMCCDALEARGEERGREGASKRGRRKRWTDGRRTFVKERSEE